ncbi:MAG: UDP-N-acetylmuramate dehydrogenase [Spirochaetales bacterium]
MVRNFLHKINISGKVLPQEPMHLHTSFRVGGPADVYVIPQNLEELLEVIRAAEEFALPWLVLGEGSNVLVADEGIEGVVISTFLLNHFHFKDHTLFAECGVSINSLVDACCLSGKGGIEFLAGMPGTLGGAIWMNARCYGSEIAPVLGEVTYLDENLETAILPVDLEKKQFAYKRSPFQGKKWVILKATLNLYPADPVYLQKKAAEYRADRELKGHYLAPSAGSIFKNDRTFGAPTGVILDHLGFKGKRIGDAEASPLHANIIINRGKARAQDIYRLIQAMQDAVVKTYGRSLELEVLLLGRWDSQVEKAIFPPQ